MQPTIHFEEDDQNLQKRSKNSSTWMQKTLNSNVDINECPSVINFHSQEAPNIQEINGKKKANASWVH
jgi:hypothetical protein